MKNLEPCDNCPTGLLQPGPFDTKEGPFVFCEKCGYRKTSKSHDDITMSVKPAIRYPMMPRHTNQYGTVFGGIVLSLIDQSAAIESRKYGLHRWVTASVDKVDFLKPIRVGDTIDIYTETIDTGTKSVKVGIKVEVERYEDGKTEHVCQAKVTMVSVGPDGTPIPFKSPPTIKYKS